MKNNFLFIPHLFLFLIVLCPARSFSQQPLVRTAVYSDVTIPLRDIPAIPLGGKIKEGEEEIPNKIGMKEFRNLRSNDNLPAVDPVLQQALTDNIPSPSLPIQNFEGINNTYGVYPPDTQGDVGPNYYVQVVNLGFQIWNKTGTSLYGPANLSTIWAGIPSPWNGTNNGDPVVLYDQAADRWMISQFSLPNSTQYAMLVAVSQTSDPTGSWYRYVFEYGNRMPDYPKFGIWPDGYYLSVNQFISGSSWGGVGASALERSKMLTGDPTARMVYFDLGGTSDPSGMLPSDWDGTTAPIAGEPNYFTYFNDWSSPTTDYLKIWQFHVDWTNTANSTFSEAFSLVAAPFKSEICSADRGQCIPQPGTTVKLESLSDRLMFRLQYLNFGSYRTMVTNHTVDVDNTGHAGIRWYELRNSGSGWSIYQQGTFAPDASNRWLGSVAMNSSGDIALGYSVSNGTSLYPSIRYTGRKAGEPLGMMTYAEQTIKDGTGSQTGSAARWGDYSMMSVDPLDNSTFWYTTEYIQNTGATTWRTRIASFLLAPVAPVADFYAATTKPCLNSTDIFTDQTTGLPTSWSWSVTPSTFAFVDGTTSASQNPHLKFTAFGNYTVTLSATNAQGNNVKTKTNYISVNNANADFAANPTSIIYGNSVTFTDASTCSVNSWSWNFGSGASPATANTQGPHVVTYSTIGQKTVSLTVNGSVTETKTNYINVTDAIYNMNSTTVSACVGNFYDPGGVAGDYSSNLNYTMVFNPSTPGSVLKFVFTSFNLEYEVACDYDYLKIYDGTSTAAPLIGTYCGTSSPGTVTATGSTGALTFVFHSDPYVNGTGWSAAISCVPGAQNKMLTLTCFLEGLYSTSTGSMNQAQECLDGSVTYNKFTGLSVDTLSVLLAQAASPWAWVYQSHGLVISPNGSVSLVIPSAYNGNYYIAIKHRQSVETWSATPISFAGSTISYNFTTAAGQAYGNNEKQILPEATVFGLYAGDITSGGTGQDGYVDIFDNNEVFNKTQTASFGYISSDLNGDGFIDIFDMALVFNNMQANIGLNTPLNPGKKGLPPGINDDLK